MLTTAIITRSAAISKINMLGRPLVASSSRMYSSVLSGPVQFKESATHHPQTMPLTDTTVYTAQGSTYHDEDASSFSPVVNTVFDD